MTTRIGILSDTHLSKPTESFQSRVASCFADVPIIIHAGDLTSLSILDVFDGRTVHAVHGNMCGAAAYNSLPRKKIVTLEHYTIGIIHRTGYSYDFEEYLLDEFPEADCIVYGHTHRPACHRIGKTLFINPGSFMATGRHGAAGTFAILEVGDSLHGQIYEVKSKT